MADFPPAGPTTIQNVIPSYLYQQYADDDDLQALVAAYNQMAQAYVTFFNDLNLPVYTGLTGALLDWVGQGVYGYPRPTLPSGALGVSKGGYNTYPYNTFPYDGTTAPIFFSSLYGIGHFAIGVTPIGATFYSTSDDGYQRCLTWHFYKGDGKTFSVQWLKRRVMRFLNGVNGTASNVDETYDVSVSVPSRGNVTITLSGAAAANPSAPLLQQAVQSGALELPFQYNFTVVI